MHTEFGASGTLHAVEQCHIKGRLPFISLPLDLRGHSDAASHSGRSGLDQLLPVTRQITSPTSSAISNDFLSGPITTPTGLP